MSRFLFNNHIFHSCLFYVLFLSHICQAFMSLSLFIFFIFNYYGLIVFHPQILCQNALLLSITFHPKSNYIEFCMESYCSVHACIAWDFPLTITSWPKRGALDLYLIAMSSFSFLTHVCQAFTSSLFCFLYQINWKFFHHKFHARMPSLHYLFS